MINPNRIQEFKSAHKRFIDALRYITENEPKLKADPAKWEKIKANFYAKFEEPLDSAWKALTKEEQKQFALVYLHRKAASDETVKKVIDVFNAEIKNIEEE